VCGCSERERERGGLLMVMMCVVVHLVIFHLIRYAQIQKTEKSTKVKSALVLDKQRA
jgi:hypothetical protein